MKSSPVPPEQFTKMCEFVLNRSPLELDCTIGDCDSLDILMLAAWLVDVGCDPGRFDYEYLARGPTVQELFDAYLAARLEHDR
jgi:hypothetical protein